MKAISIFIKAARLRQYLILICAMSASIITGCGTTSTVMDPIDASEVQPYSVSVEYNVEVSDDWKYMFESKLDVQLSAARMKADQTDTVSNLAEITFITFRLRDDGTRLMAGIFAGTDEITSNIVVRDSSGNVIGNGTVTTTNSSAWGSNDGYLEDHARDIVKFLQGNSEP